MYFGRLARRPKALEKFATGGGRVAAAKLDGGGSGIINASANSWETLPEDHQLLGGRDVGCEKTITMIWGTKILGAMQGGQRVFMHVYM